MNYRHRSWLTASLASLTVLALSSFVARATPYASEVKNVSGTVSFTLNEGGSVKISHSSGTTNTQGNLAAGSYSFVLGAANPVYVIVTSTNGAVGYKSLTGPLVAGRVQLPTNGDPATARFPTPRGLAVNKNPASTNFGRVYVANSTPGPVGAFTPARTIGRGLYVLKSDFSDSPMGFGTNAQNGNIKFAGNPGGPAASANSPYKITVGQDDNVYISDFSDVAGNLYRINGGLTNGEWVFDWLGGPPGPIGAPTNHGSLIKAFAEGSTNAGNLTIWSIDEDLGAAANNDVWRYDLLSGPMTNQTTPVHISSALLDVATVDFCKGGVSNYLYLMQNRSIPATQPGIIIVDTNGTVIANTRDLWRNITGNPSDNDVLSNLQAIAISPQGDYLACTMQGGFEGFKTYIIPLDTNGIPDLVNRLQLTSGAVIQGRAVDFDVVGNLYTASSGDAAVRAFSPGGFSIATTGNNGTFSLFRPTATVSVTASASTVPEAGPAITFTLTRSDNSGFLTNFFTMSGTATSNVDYTLSHNGTVTFAPGDFSTNITLTPVNDFMVELTEFVIF